MKIVSHDIAERTKPDALAVASGDDFRLRPGNARVDAQYVISNPSVSPYCIDAASGDVLLTELPEGYDVAASAFVYDAQYRLATRVHAVAINDMLALSDAVPAPSACLLLHSTGRCGSTLLAKALGKNGLTTFSEPDIFTQLALLGRPDGQADVDAIIALYESFARFLARGRSGPVAFKFRSVSSAHADYLAAALPNAKSLFLYRDAAEVARSYARLTGRSLEGWHLSAEEQQAWSVVAPLIKHRVGQVDGYDLMAALWAGPVQDYLNSQSPGIWLGALDYAKLVENLDAVIDVILGQLGSPGITANSHDDLSVHSQAGSHLDPARVERDMYLERELSSQNFVKRLNRCIEAINPTIVRDIARSKQLL